MSKNVAVFVDVANIFYAAKAAGVDIDYVTLLKAASAGRDLVRAYAYTGLDPENENQRQFHSFLARSGYKVVSKDIRKYGDGRIKANLDIELVVDLMRTARNLDIAVVVSGDGDFAPAIRAVQQTGVRVEVVSFRGNTSSDLIEVADVFTDITQIARVDKASSRSGRRVAAEGDLSMTEVPDKETEGMIRRRRGRGRGDRDERVVARVAAVPDLEPETIATPANVIVLPGERLSRFQPGDAEAYEDAEIAEDASLDVTAAGEGVAEDGTDAAGDRRRRRRRGGRGRGRGRRADGELVAGEATGGEDVVAEDDELLEEPPLVARQSTFGSVWDSQLGVPAVPTVSVAADAGVEDEDFEDEPEIPEYLLAERRQRGRGAPGRPGAPNRGGRAGGYQSAIDRERYGRAGAPSSSGGAFHPGPRRDDRNRDRGGRPQGGGGRGPRPDRPPMRPERPQPQQHQPAASSEPWSEVPPELEQMLRSELARKAGSGNGDRPAAPRRGDRREPAPLTAARPPEDDPAELVTEEEQTAQLGGQVIGLSVAESADAEVLEELRAPEAPGTAPAPPTRRRRTTRAAPAEPVAAEAVAAGPAEEEPAPAPRPRRRRTAAEPGDSPTTAADAANVTAAAPVGDAPEAADATPAPARRTPRRRATRTSDAEAAASPTAVDAAAASSGTGSPDEAAPARPRARRPRAAATASADAPEATPDGAEAAPEAAATPRRRRTTRRAEAESE